MKVAGTLGIMHEETRVSTTEHRRPANGRCRWKGRLLPAWLSALVVAAVLAVPSLVWAADYYVSDTAGNDGYAGTLEAPFKTISNALVQASATDTILVDDGTYLLTVELVMDKALTLRSINGRDAVEIRQTVNTNRVVSITAAGAVLSGFTVKANTWNPPTLTTINGLGICMTAAATVTNCVITGATGGGQNKSVTGGGIYMSAAGLIVDCIISNNVMSGSWGAGVAISAGTLDRCLITANKAGNRYDGGAGCGVYLFGAAATVQNCLIVKNTATYFNGAGVWIKAGTLQNCTIADNVGPAIGAGLYQTGGTARNLIVYGNSPNDVSMEGGALTYSCAAGLMTGTGNCCMPPGFVNAAADDYRLSAASPCIDAGTNTVGISYDFAAASRSADGNGDGTATIDMGCYEYQIPEAGLWCRFDASSTVGTNTLNTTFTATAKRDGAPATGESYAWNFGDTESGTGASPSHTYSAPGAYTVKLTVTDGSGSEIQTQTGLVRVVTADVYVSTNGAGIFPYASWTDAATNVQDALVAASLAAQAGTLPVTLHLTNEVYNLNGELLLETGIVVAGAGRDVTFLKQNLTLARCVRMLHAGAILQNLTVTNGNYNSSSVIAASKGLGVYMTEGLITNCIVEGCIGGGQNYVVTGGGVYMSGGLIVDCILRRNSGGMDGSGLYMNGGTADRCLITQNGGGSRYNSTGGMGAYLTGTSTLQNSLVVSNTSGYVGGGGVKMVHLNAVIQNCTIVNNTCGTEAGAGVWMTAGTLRNSILYGNTTAEIASDLSKTGGTAIYSCIPDTVAGDGNILGPPAFIDYINGDYHITGAPTVDAGTNLAWIVSTTLDLDLGRRLTGAAADMGCYEWQPPTGTVIMVR